MRIDNTQLKALARAFRWRRMLKTGTVATITEIAAKEKINASYVSRELRLALLAPNVVEAILDGRHREDENMLALLKPFPAEWNQQRHIYDAAADRRR